MIINGVNYLLLEKRGCNYWNDEPNRKISDVGNYRVFVEFTDKNGVDVCGDFGGWDNRDWKARKKSAPERLALHADLQYTDERGSWRYRTPNDTAERYTYNLYDILAFVNHLSRERYDAIKFVQHLEIVRPVPAETNFTPAAVIAEYAQKHHMKTRQSYGNTLVSILDEEYQYLCYSFRETANKCQQIRITLEPYSA